MKMIKNTDKGLLFGVMEENTLENGRKENNTEEECL